MICCDGLSHKAKNHSVLHSQWDMRETKRRPTPRFIEKAVVEVVEVGCECVERENIIWARLGSWIKESTCCLIGTEMRADRGTGGSCYQVHSQNTDIKERTTVCVLTCMCVCVCTIEENTRVDRLSTDTNKPSSLSQDRVVCSFPGLNQRRTVHLINHWPIR